MQDPVGTFDTIRDNFIRYVGTAFFIRNPELKEEREEILKDPDSKALYTIPWIEPIPRYQSTAKNFGDLKRDDLARKAVDHGLNLPDAFDETAFSKFQDLASRGLFPADRPLYKHQFEMMVRAICGESLVITAGTGSGKTESFLLPIFARLVMESAAEGWQKSVDENAADFGKRDNWWNDRPNKRIKQRLGDPDGRAAVRALILYPMNALVEDQMSRLRRALDSGIKVPGGAAPCGARQWYEENLGKGQRVYFGRYNGNTPVPGHESKPDGSLDSDKVGDLKKKLKEASDVFAKACVHDQGHNGGIEDARYFFPSVDGAEMRSRWDMQDYPPDILVTNFSMLSIMLMRDADAAVFDTTRKWLESDENNVFHLVIDELHLYRGTSGTEVAYLIRLLLHRLGLGPDSRQLRILASSASLEKEDPESCKFVREFFGREGIGILPGSVESVPDLQGNLQHEPFVSLASEWEEGLNNGLKDKELHKHLLTAYEGVAEAFGGQDAQGQGIEKLVNVLSDEKLIPTIANTLLGALKKDGRLLASSLDDFGRRVFGLNDDHAREEILSAVKGLLVVRAAIEFWRDASGDRRKDALPSFRLHWFFRNLEGLWASPDPADDGTSIPRNPSTDRPVGKIYPNNQTIVTPAGNRPLELLYCEQCGEVMMGGTKLVGEPDDPTDLSLLGGDPDLESVPDKPIVTLTQDKSYADYGVFWPAHARQPSAQCPEFPSDNQANQNRLQAARNAWGNNAVVYEAPTVDGVALPAHAIAGWSACKLDAKTGKIHPEIENGEGFIRGFLYKAGRVENQRVLQLIVNNVGEVTNLEEKYPAFPAVCPCCGEDYGSSLKKSPIRTFRTGFTKVSQTFAKELFHALPTEGPDKDDRKLIVFSDSREDAARIANDIERFHFEDMMRDALYSELRISILGRSELAKSFLDKQPPSSIAERYRERFAEEAQKLEQDATKYHALKVKAEDSRTEEEEDDYANLRKALRDAVKLAQDGRIPMGTLYADLVNNGPNFPLLIKRLKDLGINPAGLSMEFQQYASNDIYADWWRMFDFNVNSVFSDYPEGGQIFNKETMDGAGFRGIVRQNILGQVFGKLYFGFESSGLGYPCIRVTDADLNNQIVQHGLGVQGFDTTRLREVCNTVIRLLGEKFHYEQIKPRFENGPKEINDQFGNGVFQPKRKFASIVKYCENVSSNFGLDLRALEQAVRKIIGEKNPGWILRADALDLQLASDSDGVWRCTKCQRIHLHPSAGFCSHCKEDLSPVATGRCDDIWKDHYYANAVARDRAPFRLHTEELTGQTDDQAERQRHFRNIVLQGDGEPRVKVIDLLSVTTTMEVGIDIGDLRAVMQANMPPERFNYQQRAGRGGRRGQAYSVVMTLCRQRSHDTMHFEDPEAITTGKAPTPFLAMDHMDIASRIMAKGVLREAFRQKGVKWHHGPIAPPDTHGEFGYANAFTDDQGNQIEGWDERRNQMADWLAQNSLWQTNLAKALSFGVQGEEVTTDSLFEFSNNSLINLIDEIVINPELSNFAGLAERLAEGALLPMFGMPSKVRVLYHGPKKEGLQGWRNCKDVPSIDRELDLAVTEFAPGAQKTKDKRIHKSAGICPDLFLAHRPGGLCLIPRGDSPFTYSAWMSRCTRCHFVRTQKVDGNIEKRKDCPNCNATEEQGYKEFEVRTPEAFYTDKLNSGADAREEGEIISPPAARLAEGGSNDLKQAAGLNLLKQFRAEARIFTLNDNRGKLFKGREVGDNRMRAFGYGTNDTVNRWEAHDQGDKEIGLVAPKTTNVLTFRVDKVPLGIEVSPTKRLSTAAGNQAELLVQPGVNSALNSAVFLIRSVAADILDIDAEEFDICHVRRASLGCDTTGTERFSGEFVIADHLANGSGFTRWLNENLADKVIGKIIRATDAVTKGETLTLEMHGEFLCRLLDESHRHKCDWSCYSCLRNFRNMRFHPLLDWRLAISMIRILASSNEQVGLDGNWNKIELEGWKEVVRDKALDPFLKGFDQLANKPFELIEGVECPSFRYGRQAVIVRHPLWDTTGPEGLFAESLVTLEATVGQKNVLTVDSFDMLRRPSWVFQQLQNNSGVFKL
jgi:Lhr-like helicase